jgi:signal transduction histidine kinase
MNEFKTRFLNTAAHELNTPLTPIKLQLHLLRTEAKGTLAPEQARAVVLIERNIDRLGRLVGDLLEASRLQAGKLGIEHKPVDVNLVAREAIESFNEPARRAGVELKLHEGPAAIVLGDDKRLTQVLYNLLSNAVKFTEEGGRIDIDTATSRGSAVVRVSDTGVGIPSLDMKRLFQPFSQVPDPDGKPRPGTGLGLYVSKGIVELHAGRIWCESAGKGQGASFAFEIPLASESNSRLETAQGALADHGKDADRAPPAHV